MIIIIILISLKFNWGFYTRARMRTHAHPLSSAWLINVGYYTEPFLNLYYNYLINFYLGIILNNIKIIRIVSKTPSNRFTYWRFAPFALYMHTQNCLFLTHLGLSYPRLLNIQCVFHKSKDILLNSYSTVISFNKLNVDKILPVFQFRQPNNNAPFLYLVFFL